MNTPSISTGKSTHFDRGNTVEGKDSVKRGTSAQGAEQTTKSVYEGDRMEALEVQSSGVYVSPSDFENAKSSPAERLRAFVAALGSEFRALYTPFIVKERAHADWDFDAKLAKLAAKAENPEITMPEVTRAIADFIAGIRDYHVSVQFDDARWADLGIGIEPQYDRASDKQRYFIKEIKRAIASEVPFQPGDELVAISDDSGEMVPIEEAIERYMPEKVNKVDTDRVLAAKRLTRRKGSQSYGLPEDRHVKVRVRSRTTGEEQTVTMSWLGNTSSDTLPQAMRIQPRQVSDDLVKVSAESVRLGNRLQRRAASAQIPIAEMVSDEALALSAGEGGARATYTDFLATQPDTVAVDILAEINAHVSALPSIEEQVDFKKAAEAAAKAGVDISNPFNAHVAHIDLGEFVEGVEPGEQTTVGFLRIDSYSPAGIEFHAAAFQDTIKQFRDLGVTDIVIDQTSNPGGSVPYLYGMLACLTTQQIQTTEHIISLTSNLVAQAKGILAKLKANPVITHQNAVDFLDARDVHGLPVNRDFVMGMERWAKAVVDASEKGRDFTEPVNLAGPLMIDPMRDQKGERIAGDFRIVVNTSADCFSGGDFFPKMLKASLPSNRALVHGPHETSGAGGYVIRARPSNDVGVLSVSVTGSLAVIESRRGEGTNVIESEGVEPDVVYLPSGDGSEFAPGNAGVRRTEANLEVLASMRDM